MSNLFEQPFCKNYSRSAISLNDPRKRRWVGIQFTKLSTVRDSPMCQSRGNDGLHRREHTAGLILHGPRRSPCEEGVPLRPLGGLVVAPELMLPLRAFQKGARGPKGSWLDKLGWLITAGHIMMGVNGQGGPRAGEKSGWLRGGRPRPSESPCSWYTCCMLTASLVLLT